MKRISTIGGLLALCAWAALLLPFFLGAAGAHPATDDFTFAAYTHPTWLSTGSLPHVIKDAISYALRTWRDWQGTVTGVIVMALNPAVFSIRYYGLHAVALLALNLTAVFVFLRHMCIRRLRLPEQVFFPLYLMLSLAHLAYLPDMVEGIYWYNGAWFYMGAQAVALLALTLCDRLAESRAGKGRGTLWAAGCCVLLFALGMDNYITAMMTAAALLMMAMQRAWAFRGAYPGAVDRGRNGVGNVDASAALERQAAIRTALLLVPAGAGLLLSVIAPGNAVRMAVDGAHQSGLEWLVQSILWTLESAAGYFARFALKTPLLVILAAVTPALCAHLPRGENARKRCPPIAATLAGTYLILCAMIIPHMYSSGYAGSGRVINMYHSYVLLATPIAWAMILRRLPDDVRDTLSGRRAKGIWAALAAAALCVCLLGGQQGNYLKLVRDQLDGTQAAYIAQFQNEYALCEAAGAQDDVALPAWTVQTVTGKPTAFEDASVWTNESMAAYFGVAGVHAEEAAQ